MIDEIDWANPPRRAIVSKPAPRTSCVVCGLRADCLVCRECALATERSIAWLETLPADERVTKALELLRGMG